MKNQLAEPIKVWQYRGGSLTLGQRTFIMAILNITPDSFSDGGKYFKTSDGINQAKHLIANGCDVLDIGGESTRPGSQPISADQELDRILPIIHSLRQEFPDLIISVDTWKSKVADQALAAGANIINDIYALQGDPQMKFVVSHYGAGLILMNHPAYYRPSRAESQAFPHRTGLQAIDPTLADKISQAEDIFQAQDYFLDHALDLAFEAGIKPDRIMLDPGLGFGLSQDENLALIEGLDRLKAYGYPVLSAPSRKRFLREALAKSDQDLNLSSYKQISDNVSYDALEQATAASVVWSIARGADMVRIHDPGYQRTLIKVADRLRYTSLEKD